MKKAIFILIALLIVGAGGWFLFLRNSPATPSQTPATTSPFGSGENLNIDSNPSQPEATTTDTQIQTTNKKLFQISTTPVAGYVTLTQGTTTKIRYIERGTGNIFDFSFSTTTGSIKRRITNHTIPTIYEAYFNSDGSQVLIRSLDKNENILNITLTLTPPKTSSTTPNSFYSLTATQLRGDLDSVAVANNTLFYVLKDLGAIVSSSFVGSGAKNLFTSAFKDWQLARAGSNLVIYPKADSHAVGYSYLLNTTTGGLTKIAGPFNGLTTTSSKTGDRFVYSYSDGAGIRTFAKTKKGTITEIVPGTFAEKCIWSEKRVGILFCAAPNKDIDSLEPERWYQGKTHFSDLLWHIDTEGEIGQVLVDPPGEQNVALDMTNLALTPNEDYLVFINQIDLTLWAIKL